MKNTSQVTSHDEVMGKVVYVNHKSTLHLVVFLHPMGLIKYQPKLRIGKWVSDIDILYCGLHFVLLKDFLVHYNKTEKVKNKKTHQKLKQKTWRHLMLLFICCFTHGWSERKKQKQTNIHTNKNTSHQNTSECVVYWWNKVSGELIKES